MLRWGPPSPCLVTWHPAPRGGAWVRRAGQHCTVSQSEATSQSQEVGFSYASKQLLAKQDQPGSLHALWAISRHHTRSPYTTVYTLYDLSFLHFPHYVVSGVHSCQCLRCVCVCPNIHVTSYTKGNNILVPRFYTRGPHGLPSRLPWSVQSSSSQ